MFEREVLLTLKLPEDNPPVSIPGKYTFAIGSVKPGTDYFISPVASVNFMLK